MRNGEDIVLPFCRLSVTNNSFIPNTIRHWNNLDTSIRNSPTIREFKNALKETGLTNGDVPRHFSYGPRKLNIILTQLRCSASFLNNDLYKANLVPSPSCRCGFPIEDANHFFLVCPLYRDYRAQLLNRLNWLQYPTSVAILTQGDPNLSYDENILIFREVFDFIKRSARFNIT